LTLRDVLMQSATDYAERPALGTVDGSTVLHYRDVAFLSAAFARQLVESGLKRGDRVVVLSENRPEWGVAYIGATAAGFVIVPILTDFIPSRQATSSSTPRPRPSSCRIN
jgi:long-chain acyl-CoA synthetase